jgi:signal transduction histidine kinase
MPEAELIGLSAGLIVLTITAWWYPLPAAAVFAAGLAIPGIVIGPRWGNEIPNSLVAAPLALSFVLGARLGGGQAAIGLLLAFAGMTTGDLTGGIVADLVMTVPAFAAGQAFRARATIVAQLDSRARDLDAEREAYAREKVRYERARIARDLHDVVAHNLSAIVVQAGAGRRALDSDPAAAAGLLANIEHSAATAGKEITSLVHLLGNEVPTAGLGQLDELIRHAATAGLDVAYTVTGRHARVPAPVANAAFHVAQEGITNALKHAPGAPIEVRLDAGQDAVSVTVENGPRCREISGLEHAGGGFGLAGLADRVHAAGGTLDAGDRPDGGWRLAASF